MVSVAPPTGIEFLDLYQQMLHHQLGHWELRAFLRSPRENVRFQPLNVCLECKLPGDYERHGLKRRFSWAVPNERALETIAKYSPDGVVEIGAGGGYWAMLLQQRGVDVVAFDPKPAPEESEWHAGRAWTAVHVGDHTVVTDHPDRTLLLCWPSYSQSWAAEALKLYRGDTVIYIGEGSGGCTADSQFHALLGQGRDCWHLDDDCNELPCPEECPANVAAQFEEVDGVAIPQWNGIHDDLSVYRRLEIATKR